MYVELPASRLRTLLTPLCRAQTSVRSSRLVRAAPPHCPPYLTADHTRNAVNARTPSSSPEAFATPVDALPLAFSIHFSSSASSTKRSHRRSGSEKLAKLASLIGLGRSSYARNQRSRSVHVTVEQEVAVEQREEEHELKSLPSLGDVDLEAGAPSTPPPARRYTNRPSYSRGPTSTMFSTMSAGSSVADRCAIAPFATEDEVRSAVQAEEGRAERGSWSGGSEEGRGGV